MDRPAFAPAVRGFAIEPGGTIRLSHALVRAAALDEIPPERRVDVHRRLGEWLELTAGSDLRRLREALGHKHAAGLPCLDLAVRLRRPPPPGVFRRGRLRPPRPVSPCRRPVRGGAVAAAAGGGAAGTRT